MKVHVSLIEFNNVLKKIDKLSIPKSTMPIIGNYKLVMRNNHTLNIIRASFDVTVCGDVEADCDEYGSILIPDRIINMIKKMKSGMMTITDNKIFIGKKEIEYLKVHEGNEYIDFTLDNVTDRELFKVTQEELLRLLSTSYAMAQDETRRCLNGVYIGGDAACALDGHRLSLRRTQQFNIQEKFILSSPAVKYLNKILDKKSCISVTCRMDDKKRIEFKVGDVTVISNIVDEEFIKYKQIVPDISEAVCIAKVSNIKEFENTLIFLNEAKNREDKVLVRLNVGSQEINIENNSGEEILRDKIECITTGKDIEICFNNKLLLEMVKQYREEAFFNIYLYSSVAPVVISSNDKDLELVLPVRMLSKV